MEDIFKEYVEEIVDTIIILLSDPGILSTNHFLLIVS